MRRMKSIGRRVKSSCKTERKKSVRQKGKAEVGEEEGCRGARRGRRAQKKSRRQKKGTHLAKKLALLDFEVLVGKQSELVNLDLKLADIRLVDAVRAFDVEDDGLVFVDGHGRRKLERYRLSFGWRAGGGGGGRAAAERGAVRCVKKGELLSQPLGTHGAQWVGNDGRRRRGRGAREVQHFRTAVSALRSGAQALARRDRRTAWKRRKSRDETPSTLPF